MTLGVILFHGLLTAQSLSYTLSWPAIPVVDITIQTTQTDTIIHGVYHPPTRTWF